MRSLLLASALVAACSRPSSSQPAARAPAAPAHVATPTPAAPALPAPAPGAAADHEAEEQREIMEAMREMSSFPDTDEGARDFVRALAREARAGDRDGWERLARELVPDAPRFELGLSFEGSRRVRDRVVPTMERRAEALRARLAGLREPLAFAVRSATGETLADGAAHGFDPDIARARGLLRTALRYVRVDVTDAAGERVTLQPLAFLAARWTWMGEFWSELPAVPAVPAAPPTPAPRAAR